VERTHVPFATVYTGFPFSSSSLLASGRSVAVGRDMAANQTG